MPRPLLGMSTAQVGILVLLFFTAFGVRLLFVNPDNENVKLFRDEQQYVQYARNILHHGTYSKEATAANPIPDSFRSPGYPLLIALSMKVGGENGFLSVLFYTQALLSALLAPMTFLAGLMFMPLPAAAAAAVLTAFSPHLITTAPCVLSETLFAFLLLAAMCVYLYASAHKKALLYGISGLLFGLAYITNEIAFFIPIVFAVISIGVEHLQWKSPLAHHPTRRLILFLLIFALFPAGWITRNAVSLPADAERGSARAVATMSHGAYPNFIYKNVYYQRFPYREDPEQPAFGSSFNTFADILWQRVRQEPTRYLTWYLIGKPYYFWRWSILQGVGDIYIFPLAGDLFKISPAAGAAKRFMQGLHVPLLLLAAVGALLLLQHHHKQILPASQLQVPLHFYAVCIYATLLYMVFAPWPRYSIPFRPQLYLCAVWAALDLIQRAIRWSSRT